MGLRSLKLSGCFVISLICQQARGQALDSLATALRKAESDTHRVSLLYQMGYAHWLQGNDSLASLNTERSAVLAVRSGFAKGEARARLFIARIEVDRLSNIPKGLAQVDTVLLIASKSGDRHLEGEAYLRKAQLLETIVSRQKEIPALYDKALQAFRQRCNMILTKKTRSAN